MTAGAVILPVLGGVIALLLLGALLSPRFPSPVLPPAMAGLCALAVLAGLLGLASPAMQAVPVGLGLSPGALALDPLSAWFLLPVGLVGLAAAGARIGGVLGWRLPALVGLSLLVVLAGDAGIAALGLAGLAALGGGRGAVAGSLLAAGSLVVLSLGPGPQFDAIRAAPPEGWRAASVLALLLPGLVLIASGRAVSGAGVLLPVVAAFVVCRVALDLSGPATPAWWGAPMALLGAGIALAGIGRSLRAPGLHGALDGVVGTHGGIILAGAGITAIARSADLLPLATLAASGTLLHALALAVFGALAAITAEAATRGAGTQSLDRLGGLAARMPLMAAGLLVAGCSLAVLPLSAGFAGFWMLMEAGFAAVRLGGLPLHLVMAASVLALALSAPLAMASLVRLGGMAFLGRPRTPRAAAAEEASRPERATVLGLGALCLLLGVLPGLAVRLADPAQRLLTQAGLDGQAGWAGVQAQRAAPGYAPIAVAVLVGAGLLGLGLAIRRRPAGTQTVPAWEDGFAPPPAWMPFGDPATQATAGALGSVLPRIALPRPWTRIRLHAEIRWPQGAPAQGAMALLGLAVALLVAVLALGPS